MRLRRLLSLSLVLSLLLIAVLSCAGGEFDDYYETAEDCLPDEVYDEVDQLCYPAVDCEGEDCAEFDEDLVGLFFDLVDELLAGHDWETEDIDLDEDGTVLITYEVQDSRIVNPETALVSDELANYQEDTDTHQKIWAYFANMIPAGHREDVVKFVVFTDGVDGAMAAVDQDTDDPTDWVLSVDIADAADPKELTYTFVHEFGHLLTLDDSQVQIDPKLFYQPDDEALYEQAAQACANYFPGEGCSLPSSYINAFVGRFWADIYDEWLDIETIEDDDAYYGALEDFYYKYEDVFVTDYAATNPEEDIAESWAYFVLKAKPDGDTIAEAKVLFFYEWPELTKLRAQIIPRTYSRLRRE